MKAKKMIALLAFAAAVFSPLKAFCLTPEVIKLEWLPMPEAKRYEIEIKLQSDKEKAVVSQSVEAPTVTASLKAGLYSYRVRAILAGWVAGPWSDYLDFEVSAPSVRTNEPHSLTEAEAPSKPVKAPAKSVVVAQAEAPPVAVSEQESFFSQSSIAVKVWMGPVYSYYSGRFVDELNSTTASTLSEVYGLSAVLKNKNEPEPSGLAIGADVSLRRQRMVRSSATLPNASLSLSYHWSNFGWSRSLFTEAGVKTVGLFIVDSSGTYATDNVLRTQLRSGIKNNYHLTPQTELGLALSAGIDAGGSSSIVAAGNFKPSPCYEVMVSASYKADRIWNLGISLINENLSWSAADGSNSSLNTSMMSVTLGTTL